MTEAELQKRIAEEKIRLRQWAESLRYPKTQEIHMACRLAQAAADEAQQNLPVTFDPTIIIAIITALLPLLSSIFSGCTPKAEPSPGDVRDFVKARYRNGQYGAGVLNHAIRQTRQAARQKGNPINRADAETIAVAALDQIRLSDDETLQEAMTAA